MATILRARSTLQFAFAPFFFYFVQSVIYTLYGYTTGNQLVFGTSFLGVVLGGYYVASYMRYAADRTVPRRLLGSAAVFLLLLVSQAAIKSPEESQMIIGVPANVLSLLTASSPLLQLPTILRLKDASGLPSGMSTMNIVAGSVWTTYGIMLGDPLVILPNGFALTMGIIQVSLILLYPGGKVANAAIPATKSSETKKGVDKKKKKDKDSEEIRVDSPAGSGNEKGPQARRKNGHDE